MLLTLLYQGDIYHVENGDTLESLRKRFGFESVKDLCLYHNRYCPNGNQISVLHNLTEQEELYLPKYDIKKDQIYIANILEQKKKPSFGEEIIRQQIQLKKFDEELIFKATQRIEITKEGEVSDFTVAKNLKLNYITEDKNGHILCVDIETSSEFKNKMLEVASLFEMALFPIFIKVDFFGHYLDILLFETWKEEFQKRTEIIIKTYESPYCMRLLEDIKAKIESKLLFESYLKSHPILQNLFFPIYRDFSIEKETKYYWYLQNIGSFLSKGEVLLNKEKKGINYETDLDITPLNLKQLKYHLHNSDKELINEHTLKGNINVQTKLANNPVSFSEKNTYLNISCGELFNYFEKTSLKLV
ncbi:hypothetical protein [Aureivirga marina]|uniref:hypothetical protein n=1 Tax=Aureivirga marina TaxID=1182451 RepID=UPI0018C99636|nr:hypothetical protein [Aureivirga marina]